MSLPVSHKTIRNLLNGIKKKKKKKSSDDDPNRIIYQSFTKTVNQCLLVDLSSPKAVFSGSYHC